MSFVCPAGHQSTTFDYCDTCGAAINPKPTQAVPVAAPPTGPDAQPGAPAPSESVAPTTPTGWVAVVEVDPEFFAANQADGPASTAPLPKGVAAREVVLDADEIQIGRHSDTKRIHPDIDLGLDPEDPGVSRRHAVLRYRGEGVWEVVDVGSTNGTRVNDGTDRIAANRPVALAEGDRIFVGMWSRITLQKTVD